MSRIRRSENGSLKLGQGQQCNGCRGGAWSVDFFWRVRFSMRSGRLDCVDSCGRNWGLFLYADRSRQLLKTGGIRLCGDCASAGGLRGTNLFSEREERVRQFMELD